MNQRHGAAYRHAIGVNMLLSSRLTFFYKYVAGPIWGALCSYCTAQLFTDASNVHWAGGGIPPAWAKWVWLAFLVVGGFVFWRVCYPLKRVVLDDGQLRVSNFLREIVVPLADIRRGGFEQDAEIDESVTVGVAGLNRRRLLVGLELRRDSAFGRLIEFLPRSDDAMSLLESRLGQRFTRPEPAGDKEADEFAEELRGRGTV